MFEQLAALRRSAQICHIYEDPLDGLVAASRFIEDGLARGEHCLYIVDPVTAGDVVAALTGLGVGTEPRTGARCAGPDRASQRSAIRVVIAYGSAERADPHSPFLAVCELLQRWFRGATRVLILEQFDRMRTPLEVLDAALTAHPYVLLGDRLCRNVFWDPPGRSTDAFVRRQDRLDWRLGQLAVLASALAPTAAEG